MTVVPCVEFCRVRWSVWRSSGIAQRWIRSVSWSSTLSISWRSWRRAGAHRWAGPRDGRSRCGPLVLEQDAVEPVPLAALRLRTARVARPDRHLDAQREGQIDPGEAPRGVGRKGEAGSKFAAPSSSPPWLRARSLKLASSRRSVGVAGTLPPAGTAAALRNPQSWMTPDVRGRISDGSGRCQPALRRSLPGRLRGLRANARQHEGERRCLARSGLRSSGRCRSRGEISDGGEGERRCRARSGLRSSGRRPQSGEMPDGGEGERRYRARSGLRSSGRRPQSGRNARWRRGRRRCRRDGTSIVGVKLP